MNQLSGTTGNHVRVRWGDQDDGRVIVHARNDQMQGRFRRDPEDAQPFVERYERAKRHFDVEAAADVVGDCFSYTALDVLIDRLLAVRMPALIVMPHPQFDVPKHCPNNIPRLTNALPSAFAAYIAEELGCDIDKEIIETARPGRTSLNMFERFLWQPRFEGAVRRDRAYVLVDDVCTNGGTLSSLRSHIVGAGGTVLAATTLAHRNGNAPPLRISDETVRRLDARYGNDELDNLWVREVGHDIRCLTEGEGAGLADWGGSKLGSVTGAGAVQRVREELAEAANRGN